MKTLRAGGRTLDAGNGFTIIEMMVVLAIFGIITAAIFMTMASGRASWQTNEAAVQVQENVRQGLRTIGQELRESGRVTTTSHVVIGGSNDSIWFQVPIDHDMSTAEFDLNSGSIDWGAEAVVGQAIRYDLQGDQLIRQVVDDLANDAGDVGDLKVLANHISSVSFEQVSDGSGNITGVDVALTAQETSLSRHQLENSQRLHVKLRNVYE